MLTAKTTLTPQALLRGVFCVVIPLLFCSCQKDKKETPTWQGSPQQEQVEPSTPPRAKTVAPKGEETVLMVYNLRNYLNMPRGAKEHDTLQPKPEHEISALVNNIIKVRPHLLGVCEVGSLEDLKDLQSRLSSRGLIYPHMHLTSGSDTRRKLGILSQHSLTKHPTPDLSYQLDGHTHQVLRGILDVSISLNSGDIRLLGVHLKSKRPNNYWDQALVRRHEAQVLRNHIDKILSESNNKLLVYGDLNDTKQSSTIRCIRSGSPSSQNLRIIDFRASDGSRWTHYWEHADVYSRFDYAFASPSMSSSLVREKCSILDIKKDDPASDHRPLVLTFR